MENIEIKRLTTKNDIAGLLKINDDVENFLPCSKGEWIQWLEKSIIDKRLFIMVAYNKNNYVSYIVAMNNVVLPISNCIYVLYLHSPKNFKISIKFRDELIKWTQECGGKRIFVGTKKPELIKKFGFRKTGDTLMELIV